MKIVKIYILLLALALVSAVIANFPYGISESQKSSGENTPLSLANSSNSEWLAVLKQVPRYYQPKLDSENSSEQNKPSKEVFALTDATLNGIVLGQVPSIILSLPKEKEPITLVKGDSWLPPWELNMLYADRVVWLNIETNESETQFLFK